MSLLCWVSYQNNAKTTSMHSVVCELLDKVKHLQRKEIYQYVLQVTYKILKTYFPVLCAQIVIATWGSIFAITYLIRKRSRNKKAKALEAQEAAA